MQKKYRNSKTGDIWDVLFEDDRTSYLEHEKIKGRSAFLRKEIELNFTEYKEPKTLKGYVNVYETEGNLSFGSIRSSYAETERVGKTVYWPKKHLNIMEINWVEKV